MRSISTCQIRACACHIRVATSGRSTPAAPRGGREFASSARTERPEDAPEHAPERSARTTTAARPKSDPVSAVARRAGLRAGPAAARL
eukprot:7377475-Prymnesium_polylepis.3